MCGSIDISRDKGYNLRICREAIIIVNFAGVKFM